MKKLLMAAMCVVVLASGCAVYPEQKQGLVVGKKILQREEVKTSHVNPYGSHIPYYNRQVMPERYILLISADGKVVESMVNMQEYQKTAIGSRRVVEMRSLSTLKLGKPQFQY